MTTQSAEELAKYISDECVRPANNCNVGFRLGACIEAIKQRDSAKDTEIAELHDAIRTKDVLISQQHQNIVDLGRSYNHQLAEIAQLKADKAELVECLRIILITHDLSCKGEECQISGIDMARALITKHTTHHDTTAEGK